MSRDTPTIIHILRQASQEVSNGHTVGVPQSEDMLASPAGTHPNFVALAPKWSAGVAPM